MTDAHRNPPSDAATDAATRPGHDAAAPDGGLPRPAAPQDTGRPIGSSRPARRVPAPRRPLSAGRGPGSGPGRGTPRSRPTAPSPLTRTTPGRRGADAATAAARLPTTGAQLRAQERRPHLWFAQQLLLTLSGQRPVHVLLGHALPTAYDRLVELAPQAPLRPLARAGRAAPAPTLRECGLCRPCAGVIEAFARIATGERLRALAFRLELGADTRWRCAAVDIGPTPEPRIPAPRS
ncbi:Rv3235 family protein [Streptomyces sp. NPDC048650]|uniref:Rv3235 family protein n=1 Tax=unclassified Streptomyces TaxID=2593676 RepID=UPI00371CF43B